MNRVELIQMLHKLYDPFELLADLIDAAYDATETGDVSALAEILEELEDFGWESPRSQSPESDLDFEG